MPFKFGVNNMDLIQKAESKAKEIAQDIISRGIQEHWSDYASDYGFAFNVIDEAQKRYIDLAISKEMYTQHLNAVQLMEKINFGSKMQRELVNIGVTCFEQFESILELEFNEVEA